MTISPKAADFACIVNGKELAWNDAFGLRCRWRAAERSNSILSSDMEDGAELATDEIRKELGSDRVLVVRR